MKIRIDKDIVEFTPEHAAEAGDHFSGLQVQYLMADGAVHVAFLFCLLHQRSKGVIFHFTLLTKKGNTAVFPLRSLT